MGRSEREKGTRGEREVVLICNTRGFRTWRVPNSGGLSAQHGKGDIAGLPGIHVEVKRAERLRMDEWSAQSEGDAAPGDMPVVVYRSSGQPWRMSLLLEDGLDLLKEAKGL